MNLDSFRRQFEDPGRGSAFTAFFVAPAVVRAYQEAKGAFAEEGSAK